MLKVVKSGQKTLGINGNVSLIYLWYDQANTHLPGVNCDLIMLDINRDAALVHLICNAIKMPFWICSWAYAIVSNPLNSHVTQGNCRHAHVAPVTSCVSHLEQLLQRGANGRTALLCTIDNEPLTSIIQFQSSPVTIQGVCRKLRYLPLRLCLNHCKL